MEIVLFLVGLFVGAGLVYFIMRKSSVSFADMEKKQREIVELNRQVAELSALNSKKEEFSQKEEEMQKKLSMEFENLASKILKENTNEFNTMSKKELDSLLEPFRTKINEFQKKVEENIQSNEKNNITFDTQIRNLIENNRQIEKEARNLASALKGSNKIQGNWGEMQLKRIFELSGLQEGVEYSLQTTIKSETDSTQRPDAVVYLPDNRQIIVDSKVSLNSYVEYFNSENEVQKSEAFKKFLESLKQHIKGLAQKEYYASGDLNSPDFVLLFVPSEACFSLVLQMSETIFSEAWNQKIILVSPTTLLATLKSINLFWVQAKQNQNAINIADESGKLYDSFVALIGDLASIEKSFKSVSDGFTSVMNRLSEGRGNITKRIENLKKLGAKAKKQIPQELLSKEEDEDMLMIEEKTGV